MELNEFDVRKCLIKEYMTTDEMALLSIDDHFIILTGRIKSETKVYNDKPREELYAQIRLSSTQRETWLKLTNPIMKELGGKIGYLSSTWAGHTLKLKTDKWNGREVIRVEVVKSAKLDEFLFKPRVIRTTETFK